MFENDLIVFSMTIGMTDGEKVNIEIVEMWFYHSCTYVCMEVNDESISKNDKLIYTCIKWKMSELT
jgi:hypothetical protein